MVSIFIYRVALAKQGDNRIGSVCPSVRLRVLSCLNRLTYDLCLRVCNQWGICGLLRGCGRSAFNLSYSRACWTYNLRGSIQIYKKATWHWCEPTCLTLTKVTVDLNPSDLWPWPVIFEHYSCDLDLDLINCKTTMRLKITISDLVTLTFDLDLQSRPLDHPKPCPDQISWP